MDGKTIARSGPPVGSGVVEAWLASQSSTNTRSAYRTDLNTFGRWCSQRNAIPLAMDTTTLLAFQLARELAGDSDATMRRRWSSLSSLYQFAIDAGSIETNPVDGLHRPTAPAGNPSGTTVLSAVAVGEYLAVAAALDPRLDALVSLIVFDGLKLGEALSLDVNDINGRPPKSSLTIRRHGNCRRFALSEASARAVHRCAGRRRGQPLFTSASSAAASDAPQRLTRFGADHLLRQLADSGHERVTANTFRRFYIASKHEAGTDLDELRDTAGLSDRRGVRRYISASDSGPDATDAHDDNRPFSQRARRRTAVSPQNRTEGTQHR